MRVAVLSDVHANAVALESVLADSRFKSVDFYVFLGDLVINGPSPKESLDLLRETGPQVCIKGNTDAWFDEIDENWQPTSSKEREYLEIYRYAASRLQVSDIETLKTRPVSQSFDCKGVKVLAAHGSPRSFTEGMDSSVPREKLEEMVIDVGEDVILCGHTHTAWKGTVGSRTIVNVGSVGFPVDRDIRASYCLMEVEEDRRPEFHIIRVEYDLEENIGIAVRNDFPFIERYEKILRTAQFQ
jgi:putative phosphoesterase